MQRIKYISMITAMIAAVAVLFCSMLTASAKSYRRTEKADGNSNATPAKDTYEVDRIITADTLGLADALEGITEVFCADDGFIYILCGEESRILVLNNDYSFNREIAVTQNGELLDFSGAQGIFADKNSMIYLADTNHARILSIAPDGQVLSEKGLPDSPLIPDGFLYLPSKILIDNKGYMYILSQGCYYGALMYAPNGEFLGFYGANTVKASALDTLSYLWDMLTSNDAKKDGSMKTLPYSFVDFCVDNDGYIVTCSGTTDAAVNTTGQIRKLSPGGVNILYRRDANSRTVSSDSYNFTESKLASYNNAIKYQNIISVDVDAENFIYIVDKTYGIVYVYDSECNLISAFGGENKDYPEKGKFTIAISLAVKGSDILIADSAEKSVTVFKRTKFGDLIHQAQALYLDADYTNAKSIWKEIIAYDSGCQLAYRGLAKCCLTQGEYDNSLRYAKQGLDFATYDSAYQEILSAAIRNHFAIVLLLSVLCTAGLITLLICNKKKKLPQIKNTRLRLALDINFHPFKSFAEIKQNRQASAIIATGILFLFFLSEVLKETAVNFQYKAVTAETYNVFYTLCKTVGLILLWSFTNWLIALLMGGIGGLKEIYISTCYCLTPLIFYKYLFVGLTYIVPFESAGVLNVIGTIVLIYVFYILSVAMMELHEFSFPKFVGTSVLTVLGMILIVFIGFAFIILLQQLQNFIYSLYIELAYR